jgi:signal transduction histidine kinase
VWKGAASLWDEPAVSGAPAHGRRDWIFAAVVLSAVLAEALFHRNLVWRPIAIAYGCGLPVAILYRRTHPLLAVAFGFGILTELSAATFVFGAKPLTLHSAFVVLVLAYTLFRWGSGSDVVRGFAIMFSSYVAAIATDFTGAADTIGGAAVLLFACALGVAVRLQGTSREQLVEQAKLQEREQLARELHDTVAHHVTAITIQAQAGMYLAKASSLTGAAESLALIEREAGLALSEMRAMVGALRDRDNQPSVSPQRGLADIAQLESSSTDLLRVRTNVVGELTNLTPATEAALFRVAQEAVTNAQRHAQHATRVEVRIMGSATEVQLTVVDDGARASINQHESGFGLIGMRERVTLLGGTLSAGPQADRGWMVKAVFPRQSLPTFADLKGAGT